MSDLPSQSCPERRLRLIIWSTPATWGTGHRGLASIGTYSNCHLELKRTPEFSKCNPLPISDTTAQDETLSYHLVSYKMKSCLSAFCTFTLSLLEPNLCPAGHIRGTVLLHLTLLTTLETETLVGTSSWGHITSYDLF